MGPTGRAPWNAETTAVDVYLGLERLVFFSDAVFAVAITLLALDLCLPTEIGGRSNTELLDQLLGELGRVPGARHQCPCHRHLLALAPSRISVHQAHGSVKL